MLYAATQRGLQLIVLSCTPADYAGLGAATIRLTSPELGVFLPPDTDAEPV
jgi:hypothetical protein